MEISREPSAGDWLELRVKGRLDSYWADRFKTALGDVLRDGACKVRLNLSGVTYLSSAGIGVLVWGHKQLASIRGKLVIAQPSEVVKKVLELTGLTTLLATEEAAHRPRQATTVAMGRPVHRERTIFEVFLAEAGTPLTCRVLGDPGRLFDGGFGPDDCQPVQFPATSLGIGLGALGDDFIDCQDRFGEIVVAAGAAAYLPTDDTNVPDYLLAADDSGTEMQVCTACSARAPCLASFVSRPIRTSAGCRCRVWAACSSRPCGNGPDRLRARRGHRRPDGGRPATFAGLRAGGR